MRTILLISALFLLSSGAHAAGAGYLYNAKFVQAAPGKLLALIDHYKSRMADYSGAGDEPPNVVAVPRDHEHRHHDAEHERRTTHAAGR